MAELIEITTDSGFNCHLPKDAMDDMELVEMLAAEFSNEAARNAQVARHLLGVEGKNALYEHLRKIHGKVPATALDRELRDIFRAFGDAGKNS